MIPRYSIAEARNRFGQIVHDLEHTPQVEVTRRGRPVAVLISIREFERLRVGKTKFWDTYMAFRESYNLADYDIGQEVFAGLRDPSTGREMSW